MASVLFLGLHQDELAVVRVLDGVGRRTGAMLTGAWPGGDTAASLAYLLA